MSFTASLFGPLFGRRCTQLLLVLAVVSVSVLGLSGCDHDPDETAAQCPRFSLLPHEDGANLVRYTSRGQDLTDLVLSARITDIKGACIGVLGSKQVKVKAHVMMVLTRGPAATSAEADVPYGIGVLKRGQILGSPQFFTQHAVFPPNTNSIQVEGQELDFTLLTPKGTIGPDYHVYVYFHLTPEELALARRHR